MNQVIYLSETHGIHDQRWISALETLGYEVLLELSSTTNESVPIIVGPLTTMNRQLLEQNNPVIGLSWGFDVHELVESDDTAWFSRLQGMIVDSEPTYKIALESGLPESRIAVIPWGIDLDIFSSTETHEMHSPTRLITLRAHEDIYHVDIVLQAVSLLQMSGEQCSLTVGNTGSLSGKLNSLASDLKLKHCEFIGKIKESSLPELFHESDIYLSAAKTDGTSVTLLQAMAMSVPVVVSDSPGNIALLHSHQGPLGRTFETGNPESLANQIRECIEQPTVTEKMANAARVFVERHADWESNLGRLKNLIESV